MKRYDCCTLYDGGAMEECEDGDFVEYNSIANLLSKREQLVAALKDIYDYMHEQGDWPNDDTALWGLREKVQAFRNSLTTAGVTP
jgi:hypothetical protein